MICSVSGATASCRCSFQQHQTEVSSICHGLELDRHRQRSGRVHDEDISEDVAERPAVTEQRRTRYAPRNIQV